MTIAIAVYDPEWPRRFAREAARLGAALGATVVRLEHFGSTSVPGLAAKDIIDIQLSVAAFAPEAAYRAPLERLGYEYRPDDEPEHRLFRLESPAGQRLVHLHLCEAGSDWERRHLRFRDRLRADPTLAAAYERLKRTLAPQFNDGNAYADAKGPFIREVLARE